jgi:hypothetical protein
MNEQTVQKTYATISSIFNDTLMGIAWTLALPIRGIAWTIITIRRRRYNPEKVLCPCCGYKGEKGSDYKTCIVEFTQTTGPEQAALKHSCLRCSAPFFTRTLLPASQWVGTTLQSQLARVKAASAKGEL